MGAVFAGGGATATWLLLVGLLSTSLSSYLWLTLAAAVPAWIASAVLLRFGDRGVAAGVAGTAGLGVAIVFTVIIQQWATVAWPMW
jgi:hypothetical protein